MAEIISSGSFEGLVGGEGGVFLGGFGRAMSKVVSFKVLVVESRERSCLARS